ncbi:hypothetical protein [Nostoc sp. UHCC 0252]|uniref:hypothetical protein n=1 Tax=Nostoc sp. UHCC 0252 TaxID=3110241 RepID=UPI002B1F7FE9|nr:hypothetical protein [Nostoc sp. UHCC 0252]MEA5601058.1 hypothetical protein [Nostoc sp. UHCC 0252]
MHESLNLDDFKHILYIIRDNHKKHYSLTHKEIRVYLDCMHNLWLSEEMSYIPDSYYLPSIKFHLYAMLCRISHEKRAFLASELLKLLVLLEQPNQSKQQDNLTEETDQEPKQQNLTSEEPDPDDIPFDAATKSKVAESF